MKRRTQLTFKQWLKQSLHGKVVIALFIAAFGAIGYFTLFRSNAQSAIDSTVQVRVEGYPGTIRVRSESVTGAHHGTFGSCNTIGNRSFTAPAVCTGEQFGPPGGVRLVLDQAVPSGYVFNGWERRTNTSNGTVTCGASSCVFDFTVNGSIVRANFSLAPSNPPPPPPPPPPIGVVLRANGQTGSLGITAGTALTLSWTTTNNPSSCAAFNSNWTGAKAVPSGSEGRNSDAATAGTKTYSIVCSKTGTSSVSSTVTVNVSSQPSSGGGGGGSGGGGAGGGGSSGGGSSTRPTNPRVVVSQPANPAANQADGEPPSVPSDFLAVADEEQGVVRLSWTPSTDNVGVDHYQLERSIDQVTWEALADALPYAEYIDTSTQFTTKYFYRVRAFDTKANASGYAGAEVTTAAFKVNVTAKEGGEISSEDGSITVTFPTDALVEDAQCSVSESEEVPATQKGFIVVSGPFKVVCKTGANDVLTTFNHPLKVSVTTGSDIRKKHAAIEIIALSSEKWETIVSQNDGEKDMFELSVGNNFAVVGKTKSTPLLVKILLIFLLLAVVGGAVVGILYVRYRRQQQAQYDDYMRQQSGLWK